MSFYGAQKKISEEIEKATRPLEDLKESYKRLCELILSDDLFEGNGKKFFRAMADFSRNTPEPVTLRKFNALIMSMGVNPATPLSASVVSSSAASPAFQFDQLSSSSSGAPVIEIGGRGKMAAGGDYYYSAALASGPGYPGAILGAVVSLGLVYLMKIGIITVGEMGLGIAGILGFEFLPSILSRIPRAVGEARAMRRGRESIADLFEQSFTLFRDKMYLQHFVQSDEPGDFINDLNEQELFDLRKDLLNIIRKIKQIAEAEWNAQKSELVSQVVKMTSVESFAPISRSSVS
jgi:hypothetical protein